MKDILSCPPRALHTTKEVAEYLARKPRTIHVMVQMGRLTPKVRTDSSMYFETREIRKWLKAAGKFKTNRGAPRHLDNQKRPDDVQE